MTALHVTTHPEVVGTPHLPGTGGNPRLLVGFASGAYGWLRLPRDGPSPFTPDAHLGPDDFTDQPAFTRFPRHSLMAPGDVKAYLSFAASGPALDENRWVDVEYRVDPAGEDEHGGPWLPVAGRLTQTGTRALFPEDTTGRVLDVRERYRTLRPLGDGVFGGLDATTFGALDTRTFGDLRGWGGPGQAAYDALPTPVVAALTLREQVRPAFREEIAFTVLAHAHVARRDGASERKTPAQTMNLLLAAAQDPGHVTLTTPDETRSRFALIEFQRTVPPDGRFRRRGVAWDVSVTAVQYTTRAYYGVFDRLEATAFGDLDTRTFADLAQW